MLKLLSKLFKEKPPALDTAQDASMKRMSRMRRKSTEMAALAGVLRDGEDQNESRKDILSKARDMEIGTTFKGFSTRAKDENERRHGSLIQDWHERINHLPGFDVDPQY
jgi:Zn-finger domain-containing protein